MNVKAQDEIGDDDKELLTSDNYGQMGEMSETMEKISVSNFANDDDEMDDEELLTADINENNPADSVSKHKENFPTNKFPQDDDDDMGDELLTSEITDVGTMSEARGIENSVKATYVVNSFHDDYDDDENLLAD